MLLLLKIAVENVTCEFLKKLAPKKVCWVLYALKVM